MKIPAGSDFLAAGRPAWTATRNRAQRAYDLHLHLQVLFQSALMAREGVAPAIISQTNFRSMYWNMAQPLAHVAINGTGIAPGDLYASGTVSGPEPDGFGSGDTLVMRGWCGDGVSAPRIGFGDAVARVEAY